MNGLSKWSRLLQLTRWVAANQVSYVLCRRLAYEVLQQKFQQRMSQRKFWKLKFHVCCRREGLINDNKLFWHHSENGLLSIWLACNFSLKALKTYKNVIMFHPKSCEVVSKYQLNLRKVLPVTFPITSVREGHILALHSTNECLDVHEEVTSFQIISNIHVFINDFLKIVQMRKLIRGLRRIDDYSPQDALRSHKAL